MPKTSSWLRVNLIILILGPILILGAVKFLNGVLPKRFYFSLSSLAKGSDEPFIIDTPTVNGQRLCELLKKYGVASDDVGKYIDQRTNKCSEVYAAARGKSPGKQVSKDLKDKIYRAAFASDREAAKLLQADVNAIIRTGLSDGELQRIFDEATSVSDAYTKIVAFYTAQFSSLNDEQTQLTQFLKQKYGNLIPQADAQDGAPRQTSEGGEDAETPKLSADQIDLIKSAHAEFLANFLKADYLASRKGVDASDIDQIISDFSGFGDLTWDMRKFYTDELSTDIDDALRAAFQKHSLLILSNDTVRTAILTDVYRSNLSDYVIAGLLRIFPVFAVAAMLGIYFGRTEVLSISLAGGLTALSLVWPIVLLWDTVVQGKWHDYKPMFLSIYAVYVLTFFVTARAGALAGSAMASRLGIWQKPAVDGEKTEPVYLAELAVNLIASVIFSVLVMALNLIVPLKT
jgi:hypothetical protein